MSLSTRSVLRAVAVLVVVAALVWGSDALAHRGAQSLLERDITQVTGAVEPPQVRIGGGLLLAQVIRGSYPQIDVGISGLRTGPLRVERIDATLRDVRVPFHDVLVQDVRSVGIGRSEETVRLLYADLNAYLEAAGRPFQISPAAETSQPGQANQPGQAGQATLTGTADVLGQRLEVRAVVAVQVSAGALSLRPVRIDSEPAELGTAVQLLLSQRLTFTVPLTLPFGQRLTAISCDQQGMTVRAEGTGVVLHP